MSSYQADWMVGDDGEWLSGDEEDPARPRLGSAPEAGAAAVEPISAAEEREYSEAFAGEDLDNVAEVQSSKTLYIEECVCVTETVAS